MYEGSCDRVRCSSLFCLLLAEDRAASGAETYARVEAAAGQPSVRQHRHRRDRAALREDHGLARAVLGATSPSSPTDFAPARKFAADSPLEGAGFELAVPPHMDGLWGGEPQATSPYRTGPFNGNYSIDG